ncbi:MAG: RNA-directed DNA polymerase [Chloroflexi bacterium]|nr:RNA-directed DNA polymerase [Chloroflexota bacterium]
MAVTLSTELSKSPTELRELFSKLTGPSDIAKLLEVPYGLLVWHIYRSPVDKRYISFDIRKKSGGLRQIHAPVSGLKIIQRKLNQVLNAVYQPKAGVYGFTPGRNIVQNAQKHRNRRYVFNVDLSDFFPSIHFGRVMGLLMAVPYGLSRDVAKVLAQICCHQGKLPQGAPTSPVISNMICAKMDSQLKRLAGEVKCVYTRYADDLTFSTSLGTFPDFIARYFEGDPGVVEIGPRLKQIIQSNGFDINEDKVRLQLKNSRQEVTGLTVNERPNVRRRYVKQIRAMLHNWRSFSLDAVQEKFWSDYDTRSRAPFKNKPRFRNVLRGKIAFLGAVRGETDKLYLKYLEEFEILDRASSTGGP